MKFRESIYLILAAIVNGLAIYFALFIAPADVEMGEMVRILYFHLPPATICYLTLFTSMSTAILFLTKKDYRYDSLSESAAILGLVYGVVTLIGGSIWANATWGVYWNWDPRETTTLILWIAYLGYFFLRMSVSNPERRATVSASFNVLAFLTVPLSYLSFILWPSLHPRLGSEGSLGLTPLMVQSLLLNVVGGLIFYIWLLRKTYGIRLKREVYKKELFEEMNIGR